MFRFGVDHHPVVGRRTKSRYLAGARDVNPFTVYSSEDSGLQEP